MPLNAIRYPPNSIPLLKPISTFPDWIMGMICMYSQKKCILKNCGLLYLFPQTSSFLDTKHHEH